MCTSHTSSAGMFADTLCVTCRWPLTLHPGHHSQPPAGEPWGAAIWLAGGASPIHRARDSAHKGCGGCPGRAGAVSAAACLGCGACQVAGRQPSMLAYGCTLPLHFRSSHLGNLAIRKETKRRWRPMFPTQATASPLNCAHSCQAAPSTSARCTSTTSAKCVSFAGPRGQRQGNQCSAAATTSAAVPAAGPASGPGPTGSPTSRGRAAPAAACLPGLPPPSHCCQHTATIPAAASATAATLTGPEAAPEAAAAPCAAAGARPAGCAAAQGYCASGAPSHGSSPTAPASPSWLAPAGAPGWAPGVRGCCG